MMVLPLVLVVVDVVVHGDAADQVDHALEGAGSGRWGSARRRRERRGARGWS